MNKRNIMLEWEGPLPFIGIPPKNIFDSDYANEKGLYLWTIEYHNSFLIYYIGETKRNFQVRMKEHLKEYLAGIYRVYEPKSFKLGKKELIWHGLWMKGTKNKTSEFLNRYLELSPKIYDLLKLLRIFIAPLNEEKRILQRIEGALYKKLYSEAGVIKEFLDSDIRFRLRNDEEERVRVFNKTEFDILGLPGEIDA